MTPGYRFTVRFRLDPHGVDIDPEEFETRLFRPATPPEEDGWLFFRDHLWKGALSDPERFRHRVTDRLGVPVETIEYHAYVTDPPAWNRLRSAIAQNLELFRADSVPSVVSKYFGSTVEIQEQPEDQPE